MVKVWQKSERHSVGCSHAHHQIEVDSLDFATGAVLSQQSPEDNKWHLIAFLSKSLSPVEQNYKIHDKDMLAIMRMLEEWKHFVEGAEHPCEIWTDHKNLLLGQLQLRLSRGLAGDPKYIYKHKI